MNVDHNRIIKKQLLLSICDSLKDLYSPWVLTGSLGFALQGIPTEVNDIDLQSDKEGAFKIQQFLTNQLDTQIQQPVTFSETDNIRSYYGSLAIREIKVEVMGAMQRKLVNGEWDRPTDVRKHRNYVNFKERRIPVLSLRYEIQAYEKLGRQDKADYLKNYINAE